MELSAVECRVLGALMEKETTTPEYYPLSLNALVNACNQKNNREPVMALDEDTVRQALHSLQEKRFAGPARGADSRVTKYEHRLQEVYNFSRPENAIIAVLLLRGAQTPGELRGRTERFFAFGELDEVNSTLQRLARREPPLVAVLPRQPGTKEARWTHLFSGMTEGATADLAELTASSRSLPHAAAGSADSERITLLEAEVASLRAELADIKDQLAAFRKQFE